MDGPHASGTEDERDASRLLRTLEHLLRIEDEDLSLILTEASGIIAEALGADKVDVFLREPPTAELVAVGTSNTPMGRRQHALGLHRLPLAQGGRAAAVYTSQTPYRTGHAEEDPMERTDIVRDLGVRSTVATPLVVDGTVRGVLVAVSGQPERFTDGHLAFLQAVAGWLAVLTQRAELLARVRGEDRQAGLQADVATVHADLERQLEAYASRESSDPEAALHARLVRWRLGQLEGIIQEMEGALAVVQATFGLALDRMAALETAVTAVHAQVAGLEQIVEQKDAALQEAAQARAALEEQLHQATATVARLQAALRPPATETPQE